MKRLLITLAVLVSVVLAFFAGRKHGIKHAIEDSEHWVLDFDEHDDYDWDLHIYLDDDHYVTTVFVG